MSIVSEEALTACIASSLAKVMSSGSSNPDVAPLIAKFALQHAHEVVKDLTDAGLVEVARRGEAPAAKAVRYLAEGRVQIVADGLICARVQGSAAEPYLVAGPPDDLRCSCPARIAACAHVRAVELVTGVPAVGPGARLVAALGDAG